MFGYGMKTAHRAALMAAGFPLKATANTGQKQSFPPRRAQDAGCEPESHEISKRNQLQQPCYWLRELRLPLGRKRRILTSGDGARFAGCV